MDRLLRLALPLLLVSALGGRVLAAGPGPDGDGLSADLKAQLGLPAGVKLAFTAIATSADEKYSAEQARANAPDLLSFEGCHVGGRRVLLKVTFAHPVSFVGAVFIIYADLDANPATGRVDPYHGGTDAQIAFSDTSSGLSLYGPCNAGNTGLRSGIDGNVLYVALDGPFTAGGATVPFGAHLLSQKEGGKSDSTTHVVVQLAASTAQVPSLPLGKGGFSRALSDFRYYNDRVMYEKLGDKGLRYEQIAPKTPISFGRPCPEPPYRAESGRGKGGSIARQQVAVALLEEAGVARQAALSFGFPLPQGGLYDLDRIRLLDGGRELPAQFTATSLWADGSLKWVLIDSAVDLKAREQRVLSVEFGNNVKHEIPPRKQEYVRVSETPTRYEITTGGLQFVIDREHFNLLSQVRQALAVGAVVVDPKTVASFDPAGVVLADEAGKRYGMGLGKPDSVRLEIQGPQKVVVRAEGPYTAEDGSTYMRYVARLTFRAGSPRVEVAVTHIDDYTKTEFTDLTSLTLPLAIGGGVKQASVGLDATTVTGAKLDLLQADDTACTVTADGKQQSGVRASGLLALTSGTEQMLTKEPVPVRAVVHDLWQTWPKGISVDGGGVTFGLLPPQPSAEYGKALPYYLMYPFVEGKYRFKWGMAFTTRLSFDFGGRLPAEALLAEAQLPVVPVIPAQWYSDTKALGPLAAPRGKQFAMWDKYVADSFTENERSREALREYGYFNYGDWFGERGRNWGNNEYDLAHGLFMQFARTGDRRMFRWARVSAQHRADVDTVWAYPDPYYLGANHQHSIGHTGTWTQTVERATWTHRYDAHTSAESGHVWADGLMDDWYLTGEPRAIESALALGEHVVYAFAPSFKALGTHERSAGWSLRAIMAVYSGVPDPLYLEAAKKIAAVALQEQKFEQGGAWPHVLPQDHAGDTPGAVGNNLFLLGILLGGLQAYHEQSGDPAVLKSLTSGAAWVARCFDARAAGWPYSATTENRALYPASTGLNQLIVTPLAYTGRLTKDDKLLQIAAQALTGTVCQSAGGNGKGLAQQMFFTSGVLAELQRWYAATLPDKGVTALDGSPAMLEQLLVRTAASDRFGVRAPDRKLFFVRLQQGDTQLEAARKPHGAMNKRAEFATIKILTPAGQTVAEDKCSTDDKHDFSFPLKGQGATQFNVVVDDDQRGVWQLAGKGLQIVTKTSPDFRIGGVGRSRYYFQVPAGTKEFTLKLVGVHTGAYGAVVLTPAGKIAGSFQGSNPGAALIAGAAGGEAPRPAGHPELGELTVKPGAADTGKLWSVILSAGGDIGVDLVGVPPYLALSPETWFRPE